MKKYFFRMFSTSGNLQAEEKTLNFECAADAMIFARKFLKESKWSHQIDVFEEHPMLHIYVHLVSYR